MKEVDLIAPLVKSYIEKGYKAYAEVQLSTRWIDVLLLNERTSEVIAVELKLTEWKKAYRQAKVYQIAADYVYVGMPEEYVHRAVTNKSYFDDLGIGVLSINGVATEVIEAKKSEILSKGIKEGVIEKLGPDMEVILDEQGNLTKTFYPCGRFK